MTSDIRSLEALEVRVRHDLELVGYPPENWMQSHPNGQYDADVLIVGGGMCGLTLAFSLLRRGVRNIRVIDRNPMGREGPWLNYARMQNLRSPKHLAGPAAALPSLTCRAWFEAQWGEAAWEAIERIPRETWMDYLRWYRKILQLPLQNDTRVTRIEPLSWDGSTTGFAVQMQSNNASHTQRARKVVLASGREGIATPRIPKPFAAHMGDFCRHSSQSVDFAAMAQKRVAVVGLGASALDNAAKALEAGASVVNVLARAATVPRINKAKATVYPGFTEGFPYLPDAEKLRRLHYILAQSRVPPPYDTVNRVTAHDAFQLHLSTPVREVRFSDGVFTLDCAGRSFHAEHVILGTGFRIDLNAPPELSRIAPHIARWRDRHDASPELIDTEFMEFPYLGAGLEFLERQKGSAPYLADLHCFNYAAVLSHGLVSSDIPEVNSGAERITRAILRDFFVADADKHLAVLEAFSEPELQGHELANVRWWPPVESDD